MRWVYILKCSDDYYYVGETKRLYRRFWEHQEGIGGINTSTYIPECIVAIYKVSTLGKFFEYNNIVMNKFSNIYFTRGDTLLEEFNNTDEYYDEYDNLFTGSTRFYVKFSFSWCLTLRVHFQQVRNFRK